MFVYHRFEELKHLQRVVTTIGSFDGVHLGHQAIIKRLTKLAQQIGGESLLITFHPHPRKVLYPNTEGQNLQMIYTQKEKIELLQQTGLQHLLILPFTKEFAHTTSKSFVEEYLLSNINIHSIVVGFNHYFGFRREGDYRFLHELGLLYGFRVEEIAEQDVQHDVVSSTKIRQAILSGNIQRANAYLNHLFFFKGKLHPNIDVFRLEFESADKIIPPNGAYAVHLMINGSRYKALLYLKYNSEETSQMKTNLIIIPLKKLVNIESTCFTNLCFHKFLHEESSFKSQAELNLQLCTDLALIEQLLY
jgi:riboflavin kinase / FMN adenylyltransferase